MGQRNDLAIVTNVIAVVLAMLAAYAFAEYGAGRDPMGCNYPGTPAHTASQRPSAPAQAVEGTYQAPDCRVPKKSEEDTLCQDIRSASAAEESACAARRQLWLNLFGLGGLLATIIYTAKSALAAANAAKAAGMNVDVLVGAERAQILELIERQNIDYVVARSLDTGLPQDDAHTFSVDVSVAFKNYGKTFGILRRVSYQLECRDDLPTEPVYRERALRPVQTLEPRDESDTYYCAVDGNVITLRQARLISEGRLTVWFYGRVFYSHIFGGPDVEHRFIYHYRGGGFERIYRKNYSSQYNAETA